MSKMGRVLGIALASLVMAASSQAEKKFVGYGKDTSEACREAEAKACAWIKEENKCWAREQPRCGDETCREQQDGTYRCAAYGSRNAGSCRGERGEC
jgi:hypothetical protein